MVNIDIAGSSPGSTVVRADPGSAGGSAGRVGDDVGAVTLEDSLARVAAARDGDPVREQVTLVGVRVGPGTNSQTSKLGLGAGRSGNARLLIVSVRASASTVTCRRTGVGIGIGSATGAGTGAAAPAPTSARTTAENFILATKPVRRGDNRDDG